MLVVNNRKLRLQISWGKSLIQLEKLKLQFEAGKMSASLFTLETSMLLCTSSLGVDDWTEGGFRAN